MKSYSSLVLFLLAISLPLKCQKYNIDIQINGLKDTTLILGHYFEKKLLVNDTIMVDNTGKGIFSGDEKLPEGLYVIYLPDKNYFDFLVGKEQQLSIQTENHDFLQNMKITGSKESQNFLKYQKYLSSKQKLIMPLQEELKKVSNEDSVKLIKDQIMAINDEVMTYWDKAIQDNEGTFMSVFLRALKDIKIPDFKAPEGSTNPDSIVQAEKYYYIRNHYFDNLDLTDDRLLRTPFFANKIETYFTKIVVQIPDTMATEAIKLIEKSRPNPEMFKFMIQYLFNFAIESKMMGMDAMVVALGEKYYLSGEATWADQKFLDDLEDRIKLIKPTLIGKQAHDLKMESVTGEYYRLSEVNAPYTILVFWEPSCGHCKKEIPILHDEVWQKYKSKGIKVFAVYTQSDKQEWSDFIDEHNLNDWINVYDPYHYTRFRDYYDINSTPVIYVLDKDKKIVAKRIGVENLSGFFDHEIKYGRL